MAIINGRFYSSYGQYSPYVMVQIQRYKSALANQQYLQQASAANDAFASANVDLMTGINNITEIGRAHV